MNLLGRMFVVALILTPGAAAFAQGTPDSSYPNRFVRMVLGYAAGGGTDVVARIISDKLAERLGQPVVVENKPGGAARLAVEYVAQQPGDGYTMLIAAGAEMTIGPLISKVTYSPIESFKPLTIAIEMPLILLVSADHPAKTVAELAAWAKSNPAKSNYATTAPGFTLPAELFKLKMDIPAVGITYRSAAEGAVGLMSGAASMAFFTPPGIVNLVKEGKLRALAVTTATRSADLPNVPTLKELGIDMVITNWNGLYVPSATPQPIVDRLSAEIRHVVLNTEANERLKKIFTTPVARSPEDTTRQMASDLQMWKDVIAKANLKFSE
jgi:tripartite-type tricarboxylate transporter receptor subunit TctC